LRVGKWSSITSRSSRAGEETTVDGLRLRCRSHNQYTAERTFGAGFMRQKRKRSHGARNEGSGGEGTVTGGAAEARQPDGRDNDVFLALQTLGYRAGESRRAMALCADMSGAFRRGEAAQSADLFPPAPATA
jgi:hypothetical protein